MKKMMKFEGLKVQENDKFKVCKSSDYNYLFDKRTGFFARFGAKKEDDPQYAWAPEILDIETTTICNGVPNEKYDPSNPTGVGIKNYASPCKFCSPAGTKINTPDGFKKIENVKKGDYVIGYNLKKENIKIQEVKETYKRHFIGELMCFELDNGEILRLTPDHIVILKNGVEKPAEEVSVEDEIIYF